MISFSLVAPPSAEPVLLADAKAHARIDTNADDALVTNLIAAARQWAEKYTGRAFITQTWEMALDMGPADCGLWDGERQGPVTGLDQKNYISLPRAPLQSVTQIQYFANDDTPAVWDAANYFVDTVREPGRIALRMGSNWPIPSRLTNGILISYVAGYGTDGSSVPEAIRTAILQLVAHWYEHRGDAMTATSTRGTMITAAVPVPLVIQALLDPYRIRYTGV